jgi:hypothetical protein
MDDIARINQVFQKEREANRLWHEEQSARTQAFFDSEAALIEENRRKAVEDMERIEQFRLAQLAEIEENARRNALENIKLQAWFEGLELLKIPAISENLVDRLPCLQI